jgi:L-lactate dehydrogenase complex protein LldG
VSADGIEASVRQLHPDGDTAVTGCYAAVAEAGALVVATSPQHPLELNFLPASHVVLLDRSQLVATFECLWQQLRRDYADTVLPRCINLIVGPSRTADLGLPVKLGAHGPGRVHILLVNGR